MRGFALASCVAAALGDWDHTGLHHGAHEHSDHADHRHGSRHGHPLQDDVYSGCEEVVVGGGWAGVYFAWRRATSGAANASAVCLFERSARIGGRTYTVELNGTDELAEFTLDVGAYRFSPDMHLPGDLILNHFGLPTECYEPACPPAYEDFGLFQFNYTAPLRRVVDAATRLPAGYVTAIDSMVNEMVAFGARVFRETVLVDIAVGTPAPSGAAPPSTAAPAATLTLAPAANPSASFSLDASLVMLNLPRNHLFALPSVAPRLAPRARAMLQCVVFDMPPALFPTAMSTSPTSALSKAYAYYSDAWWLTVLNETTGEYPEGAAFTPVTTSSGLQFNPHWGDGPHACDAAAAAGAPAACRGWLEMYYAVSNETFFAGLRPSPEEPLGVLRDGEPAIATAHAALLEAIAPLLAQKGVEPASLAPPSALVVGVWDRPDDAHPYGEGYTAPSKVRTTRPPPFAPRRG